jgi:ketosteroid isomerase-like protein
MAMKHALSVIAMIVVSGTLLGLVSCQKTEKVTEAWHLTGVDSTNVIIEVSAAIDAWADSYAKMDPDKVAQFWDSSPQMMYAENGEKYANWDSIHAAIKGTYTRPVESTEVKFNSKAILPLSHNSAHVFMPFDLRVKFKPARVFQIKGYLTAFLVKEAGVWRILVGHESWKPVTNG